MPAHAPAWQAETLAEQLPDKPTCRLLVAHSNSLADRLRRRVHGGEVDVPSACSARSHARERRPRQASSPAPRLRSAASGHADFVEPAAVPRPVLGTAAADRLLVPWVGRVDRCRAACRVPRDREVLPREWKVRDGTAGWPQLGLTCAHGKPAAGNRTRQRLGPTSRTGRSVAVTRPPLVHGVRRLANAAGRWSGADHHGVNLLPGNMSIPDAPAALGSRSISRIHVGACICLETCQPLPTARAWNAGTPLTPFPRRPAFRGNTPPCQATSVERSR